MVGWPRFFSLTTIGVKMIYKEIYGYEWDVESCDIEEKDILDILARNLSEEPMSEEMLFKFLSEDDLFKAIR